MAKLKFKQLLDAGVHFGHLKRKWNPSMAPYIFDEKKGIHVIDLNKTLVKIEESANALRQIARSGRKILFVATKKQAKDIIQQETGCTVVVSSSDIIEIARDKHKTYQFLKDNNLYHPATWLPDQKHEILYPAIIKPRVGTHSRGVSIINDEFQLGKRASEIRNPMIQEVVGTEQNEYTCGVLFLDGKTETQICLQRYLRDGNTSIAYHHSDTPEIIYSYLKEITQKLQPFGPCNYQMRLDNDGTPKLFEINARFSGSIFMRTLFGLNEMEYLIKYLLHLDLPEFNPVFGKVIRYPEEYLATATA